MEDGRTDKMKSMTGAALAACSRTNMHVQLGPNAVRHNTMGEGRSGCGE